MKNKLIILFAMVAFAVALPFIGNNSVDVKNPHKLDIDGNFILYDWHNDTFDENYQSADGTSKGAPKWVAKQKQGEKWDYNLKPVQVSKRVWCFFGAMQMPTKGNAGDMSNSCYIKGNDSWIAWDSGPSYIFAEQAHAAMKKIKDMPVKTVVVSHEHDDHWLGNNYYKETQGATIYGPRSINVNYLGYDEHTHKKKADTRETPAQTRMIRALYQNAIRGTKLVPVDKSFDDTTKFTLHGVRMEYVKVGYAHSEEDWFLYLPDDKVVLVADVVMNGRVTSNRDGAVIGQMKALEAIKSRDWNQLVPGHGFITDKTAADESIQYFALMAERVMTARDDQNVAADDITRYVTLEEFRNKELYYLLSPGNVFRSYEELDMYDDMDDIADSMSGDEDEDEDE